MSSCPKCKIGSMARAWSIYGEYVHCLQCGYEPHPPLEPGIVEIHPGSVLRLPDTGEDSIPWREKRRKRGGRPPSSGVYTYGKG